jgi:hypothetical protein
MNRSIVLYALCLTISLPLAANVGLPKIASLFKKPVEETFQHEYPVIKEGMLTVENTNGSIYIKTEWSQKTILVVVKKKAKTAPSMAQLRVLADQNDPRHTIIRSEPAQDKLEGSIDYEIIVPTSLSITAKTKKGAIMMENVHGQIRAMTGDGPITMSHVGSDVIATTRSSGSITLNDVRGSVNASTKHGAIKIDNARSTIKACAEHGRIDVHYPQFNPDASLSLTTATGNITLQMPRKTSASIQAKTEKGTVRCDHPLTIKPFNTTLDSKAWARFKKEVHGTLGSGTNKIQLVAKHGSIKIVDDAPAHKKKQA